VAQPGRLNVELCPTCSFISHARADLITVCVKECGGCLSERRRGQGGGALADTTGARAGLAHLHAGRREQRLSRS